ncbi:MAG: Stf0 family sulfotransferase, partial [Pseudomonadota bacterium]
MAAYASYVICTSPRSGSTLLCSLLKASGVAGAPESLFHEPSVEAWRAYHDAPAPPGASAK